MTALEVPRGKLRAALAAVIPHAGRESDATPALGRLRFHVAGDALMVWATDFGTTALASIWEPEFLDGAADGFDLAVGEAKKILAVFRVPGGEGRFMWEKQPMRLVSRGNLLTIEETGDIIAGQSITLPLIQGVGEDKYPDVPRMFMEPHARSQGPGADASLVNLPALARFAAAAKAYDPDWPAVRLVPDAGSDLLLVEIGREFIGMLRDDRTGISADELDVAHGMWTRELEPLQRPKPVKDGENA